MKPLPTRHVGLLVPATNTVFEAEVTRLLHDVACVHTTRVDLEGDVQLDTAAGFDAVMRRTDEALPGAFHSLETLGLDHVLFGTSARTFWGGAAGASAFEDRLRSEAPWATVQTASAVTGAALTRLGATKVGLLTPYDFASDHIEHWLNDGGWELTATEILGMRTADDMARFGDAMLVDALQRLRDSGVDAIIQVGTNLRMAHISGEATRWLGTPVLAVNPLLAWAAAEALGADLAGVATALPAVLTSSAER